MNISFHTAADSRLRMRDLTGRSKSGSVFASIGEQAKTSASGPALSVDLASLIQKEDKISAGKTDASLEKAYQDYIEGCRSGRNSLPPGGVETKTPINWEADGTSILTESQIEYLKSTYNFSHMDKNSYWNLMADLTDMNVISARDIASQCVAKNPTGVVTWFTSVEDRTFGQMDVSGNMAENLSKYKNDLGFMMDWLKNNGTADSSQFFWIRDEILCRNALADRLMRIFELLK